MTFRGEGDGRQASAVEHRTMSLWLHVSDICSMAIPRSMLMTHLGILMILHATSTLLGPNSFHLGVLGSWSLDEGCVTT